MQSGKNVTGGTTEKTGKSEEKKPEEPIKLSSMSLKEKSVKLRVAAYSGDIKTVSALLNHKADPDYSIAGWDNISVLSLFQATQKNHIQIVIELLEHEAKADTNYKEIGIDTPLIFAARRGYKEIAEALLTYKADINHMGHSDYTALMGAAESGHAEVVELLLKCGAGAYFNIDIREEETELNTIKDGLSSSMTLTQVKQKEIKPAHYREIINLLKDDKKKRVTQVKEIKEGINKEIESFVFKVSETESEPVDQERTQSTKLKDLLYLFFSRKSRKSDLSSEVTKSKPVYLGFPTRVAQIIEEYTELNAKECLELVRRAYK